MTIKLKELLIIMLIICVFVIMYIVLVKDRQKKDNIEQLNSAYLLKNRNDYYDVSGIISKYINYINSKDTSSLISILDDDYVNDNHLTNSNVLNNLFIKTDSIYSFDADKMYYIEVDDNIIKYLVHGYLKEDTMDNNLNYEDIYVIVNVDKKHELFSIIPDDGILFKEASK